MMTDSERHYVLAAGYVPEHSVGLMTSVSGGEPYFIEGHLCFLNDERLIVVGYPLELPFHVKAFEDFLIRAIARFHPAQVSIVAPELPRSLTAECRERHVDEYYTLDNPEEPIAPRLQRLVERSRPNLVVERSPEAGRPHSELVEEFIHRVRPPVRIRNLYARIPDYVNTSDECIVLNAWGHNGRLAAFFVVDLAPVSFSTYVVGCHTKMMDAPGASDVLFHEMITLSNEHHKRYIHLGFGVNSGIRQFKQKWGGKPTGKCEMCEWMVKRPSLFDTVLNFLRTK